jgi:hypothetical protein
MESIMAAYPRHKVLVEEFVSREEFIRRDPFNLEGLVKECAIRAWNDTLIP